jgi:uncharacterized membrane protein YvlD (DUF360 family)
VISVLISWLLSALALWLLSLIPLSPFFDINFYDGVLSLSFLIAAVVIGLINGLLVPLVKGVLKVKSPLVLLFVSLVVDAVALILASILVPGFGIGIIAAVIAGAVLSALNLGASMVNK